MQDTKYKSSALVADPGDFLPAPPAQSLRRGAAKLYHAVRRSAVGELWQWSQCKTISVPCVEQLVESLSLLSGTADEREDTEAPIFVLSPGWRSGSTLLQRILVTDPHLLLWGEPLGEMALVSRIAATLSSVNSFWFRERCITDDVVLSSLATSWIPTLCPPGDDFRLALRSLFDRWLGEPARARGYERWGFKDVRMGATEAVLLSWLYPRAKFLVLSRHPYDCYRSLSDSGWQVFYRYPDVRADSAAGFARHWNRLATSWSELPADFPAIHIKYEDLVNGGIDFRKLESWLGVELREGVALSASVGHTAERVKLAWHERLIIAQEADRGMQALGYSK
jgi:hypothetical protein